MACWIESTAGNITFAMRDDDIDFTILGVHILDEHGFGFGPEHVAAEWLDPSRSRRSTRPSARYRNLLHGLQPPGDGHARQPYREWIGAQIRADAWGYVSPGRPILAAALAFQDASLSTANGIYGAMWAAADRGELHGQPTCPPRSTRALPSSAAPRRRRPCNRDRAARFGTRLGGGARRDREPTATMTSSHPINNAAVIAAAPAWAGGFRGRRAAVQGGWDDRNGAVGSASAPLRTDAARALGRTVEHPPAGALFGFEHRLEDLRLAGAPPCSKRTSPAN